MSSRYKCPGAAAGNAAHFQQQRSMFLPIMLCSRSSLKDVKISHRHRRASSSSDNTTDNKSHKLKRFFSTKSLPTKSNPTPKDPKSRRNYVRSNCKGDSGNVGVGELVKPINLSDLDPPLPVVRPPPSQMQQGSGQPRVRENLWKRRSGEAALQSLQLQSIIGVGGAPNLQCVQQAKTV